MNTILNKDFKITNLEELREYKIDIGKYTKLKGNTWTKCSSKVFKEYNFWLMNNVNKYGETRHYLLRITKKNQKIPEEKLNKKTVLKRCEMIKYAIMIDISKIPFKSTKNSFIYTDYVFNNEYIGNNEYSLIIKKKTI